ncbi:MAG TPA: MAPEG family protein [Burkholderiaceae bacterium]|nr:MAPEG family protein [Burkholderiaceae bacterium]
MTPTITALYAIVFVALMIALSTHVTMLRASTGISINDGGNREMALRMRRHGNFVENVPMIVLLMLLAELLGSGALWLHVAGLLLLTGRVMHAVGLQQDNAKTLLRILGGMLTKLAALVAAVAILWRMYG